MIESELPVCKIMFNVHVQCTMHYSLSYHLCTLSPLLSLPLSLPLPFFDFARSRQVKSPTKVQNVTPEVPVQSSPQPKAEASSTTSSTPAPTDMCRVQVRHPNGRVIRQNFPSSASLNDVVTSVMENEPHFSTVILVQVFISTKYKCVDLSCLSLSLCLSICLSPSLSLTPAIPTP